jgi:hypothetical protein
LATVLRYDVHGVPSPCHGDVEQSALLFHLQIAFAQKHRNDDRLLPDAGKPVSAGPVVYRKYDVCLQAFRGMDGHEPHVQIRALVENYSLGTVGDVLPPAEPVAVQQPDIVVVSS